MESQSSYDRLTKKKKGVPIDILREEDRLTTDHRLTPAPLPDLPKPDQDVSPKPLPGPQVHPYTTSSWFTVAKGRDLGLPSGPGEVRLRPYLRSNVTPGRYTRSGSYPGEVGVEVVKPS